MVLNEGVLDVDVDQDAVGVEREEGGSRVDDSDAAVRCANANLEWLVVGANLLRELLD